MIIMTQSTGRAGIVHLLPVRTSEPGAVEELAVDLMKFSRKHQALEGISPDCFSSVFLIFLFLFRSSCFHCIPGPAFYSRFSGALLEERQGQSDTGEFPAVACSRRGQPRPLLQF